MLESGHRGGLGEDVVAVRDDRRRVIERVRQDHPRWVEEDLPTVTLGRYRRYRRAAIESWVRNLEERSMPTGHGVTSTG